MLKISVCAIFKNEARYLLEWLAFHKLIGVDLFFLYGNGGSDLIGKSDFARNVTLIPWSDRPGQLSAYLRVHYALRFTWVAFIDIDEFITPVVGSSIRDIVLRPVYDPAILMQWRVFGPSGHHSRPDGLVLENDTYRMEDHASTSRHIKSLVRPEKLVSMDDTPHAAECSGPHCNTRGDPARPYAIQPTEGHDVMSGEPLLHQVARGLAGQGTSRHS